MEGNYNWRGRGACLGQHWQICAQESCEPRLQTECGSHKDMAMHFSLPSLGECLCLFLDIPTCV